MKLGHIFHALGWTREEVPTNRPAQKDPYLRMMKEGETAPVSTSAVKRSVPRHLLLNDFESTSKIDTNAVFRLASKKFDPHHMTREESRRLSALLFEGGAISRRDQHILIEGPAQRRGTMHGEDYGAVDMISAWQGKLHQDMAQHDFGAVDQASRALTILGRVVAAGSA
ncbi:MAG: hypothetical protein R3261_05820 [Alphaproteobacteria bacterium]|nr:hypothetical protein [Alphaproteobacteria bacterium]